MGGLRQNSHDRVSGCAKDAINARFKFTDTQTGKQRNGWLKDR
jgi:hypothetical protein